LIRAREASQRGQCRREAPITSMEPDGTLLEGVLDLAFDEGDRTVVVDFKTDHELSAGDARNRAQLQQYVAAVGRATGRQAHGILFRI
jgi:ATP-dependent exoDNAse (exonuclease V) beta subunit